MKRPSHIRTGILPRIIIAVGVALALAALLIPLGRSLTVRASYAHVAITSSDQWADHCSDITADDEALAIDRTRAVMINGQANPLMCTFRDPASALRAFRDTADLSDIQRHCILPLNVLTWRCYAGWVAGHAPYDDPRIAAFFDIYENTDDNDRIVTTLAAMQRRAEDGTLTDTQLSELAMLFPDYAPVSRYMHTYADDAATVDD
ncbi:MULTISPECIES: hypothetical protein [Bifidobacterium]|uniref:hypothetical protein n=1 Tax=Bifidobacterium TaxID=1678 RepID=UPI001BDD5E9F|nr:MULTISPECIES: hypothetical protein [Bifidobacterium]MBT1161296.1 hypothetical protein [Bifidobacterium sp. SO1]MBW3078343.1 hypothetical protein [Bifidobacterium simiiventris]